MRDASGLNRNRYSDVFRAIGNYLDATLFRDISLLEAPDGFILKGYIVTTTERGTVPVPQSYLFADADVDQLIEDAFARRGKPLPPEAAVPSISVGEHRYRYEDVLRAIGTLIDESEWHEVVVVQSSIGFLLKGIHTDRSVDRFLDDTTLQAMADKQHEGIDALRAKEVPPQRRRFWPH